MGSASTFWNNVSIIMKQKGITQVSLCEHCDINLQSFRNKVHLNTFPNPSDMQKIASYLNTSIEDLIGTEFSVLPFENKSNKKNTDIAVFTIPLLDQKLSAGKGSLVPDADISQGRLPAPASLRRYGKEIAYLVVNGDSMEPTLSNGDMIICDCCGWDGEGIYALRLNGDGYVKRLSKTSSSYVIISDNPRYPIREEPIESECIQIIGKVHEQLHHIG